MGVVSYGLWNASQHRPGAVGTARPVTAAGAMSVVQSARTMPEPVAVAPPIPPDEPPQILPVRPSPEALKDMDDVQFMLRDFRARLGENPVGTNAEIMKRVMGGNPANARLGPPEGQSLNDEGELLDRWGTPYFFHQISRTEMEIRSAGPDRKMYTADDIVVR